MERLKALYDFRRRPILELQENKIIEAPYGNVYKKTLVIRNNTDREFIIDNATEYLWENIESRLRRNTTWFFTTKDGITLQFSTFDGSTTIKISKDALIEKEVIEIDWDYTDKMKEGEDSDDI